MTSPEIEHIYACACGELTPTNADSLRLGHVFECPSCKSVHAHIYPQGGGRAWIRISSDDVKFHRLIK